MHHHDDAGYFAARAEQEMQKAVSAKSQPAFVAHSNLAKLYWRHANKLEGNHARQLRRDKLAEVGHTARKVIRP